MAGSVVILMLRRFPTPYSTRPALARALCACAALVLAACAGPTPYQPRENGAGYSDQQLEPDRYRVSFIGNSATERETVENYLLYRAAEITLREGKDYFVVVGKDTVVHTYGDDPGWGGTIGQGWGWGPWGHRRSTFTGLSFGTGTRTTEYSAQADIVLHSGEKPDDNPRAYDAREVQKNLASLIVKPSG